MRSRLRLVEVALRLGGGELRLLLAGVELHQQVALADRAAGVEGDAVDHPGEVGADGDAVDGADGADGAEVGTATPPGGRRGW